ncbi:MAG: DUF2520 domain-containing protein [Acidimicrobiales bacterium]|nr:DUF2520 domain-containing protein [Acidimicrobiales bacterium]
MPSLAIIGPGRVGLAVFDAVQAVASWSVTAPLSRNDDPAHNSSIAGADLVLITVPDRMIAPVSSSVPAGPVVAHASGALGLDVLAPHVRRGALHPLMTIPNRTIGSQRLRNRCSFAVEGHPLVTELADSLGGRTFRVDSHLRPLYHAAAVVASNHVVTLLAQVERLSALMGLDPALFAPLTAAAIEDVNDVGPTLGLTGPAVRADWATISGHLAALPPDERDLYRTLALAAARLGGHEPPSDLRSTP